MCQSHLVFESWQPLPHSISPFPQRFDEKSKESYSKKKIYWCSKEDNAECSFSKC